MGQARFGPRRCFFYLFLLFSFPSPRLLFKFKFIFWTLTLNIKHKSIMNNDFTTRHNIIFFYLIMCIHLFFFSPLFSFIWFTNFQLRIRVKVSNLNWLWLAHISMYNIRILWQKEYFFMLYICTSFIIYGILFSFSKVLLPISIQV